MTTTMNELSPALQCLVDARLDAIERVLLMVGVSREERRGILSEAEAHIFELLGRATSGEPTREVVLRVLAQLDPPESYAPEGFDLRKAEAGWSARESRGPQLSRLAVASAVAGLIVAAMLFAAVGLFEDYGLIYLSTLAMLVVSTVGGVSMARIYRSQGQRYGLRPAMFAAMLFPLLMANWIAFFCLTNMGDFAIFIVVALAFLAMNSALIYGVWRLCSIRPR